MANAVDLFIESSRLCSAYITQVLLPKLRLSLWLTNTGRMSFVSNDCTGSSKTDLKIAAMKSKSYLMHHTLLDVVMGNSASAISWKPRQEDFL